MDLRSPGRIPEALGGSPKLQWIPKAQSGSPKHGICAAPGSVSLPPPFPRRSLKSLQEFGSNPGKSGNWVKSWEKRLLRALGSLLAGAGGSLCSLKGGSFLPGSPQFRPHWEFPRFSSNPGSGFGRFWGQGVADPVCPSLPPHRCPAGRLPRPGQHHGRQQR